MCSDDSGSISTLTNCSLFDNAGEDDSFPSSVSTNNYIILKEISKVQYLHSIEAMHKVTYMRVLK